MANSSTPSPATAPAEAPEIKSIQELQQKKSDILGYLQSIPGLSEEEKAKFAEEFEKDMVTLDSKTEEEKNKDIWSLKAEIDKLKADIHGEKKDTNEQIDTVIGSDETTVEADQKLVEQEIRGRLDEFRTSIEAKLATPETPTATPEPVAEVPENFLPELTIPEEIPAIPNDYVSNNKPSWLYTFIINFLDKAGLSFIANWLTMRTMGYKSERQMEYTRKSMNNLLAIKESPVNSIIRLDDITEREFRDILGNHNDIDLSIPENVEAAFLGKYADNPKYKKYHRIYNGIEDMARTISESGEGNYNPIERLDALLGYSKKGEFDPEYTYTETAETDNIAPILPETETTETAPENTNSLNTIISRYDGRPYEEKQEAANKDSIFTFEKDDIFLAIKRGDQKEIININADGKLNYRGITGTPEMIIQLARLDMYVNSLPGKLTLSDGENLSQNTIKKTYFDYAADVDSFAINTMPEFLSGWDWQQLYNFLLRDGNRQIAPAEVAEMSGEKPQSVTQEDLDIIMNRTDVRETAEDAKFSGKIEEDKSVTITRATEDGEKKWDETIFPNADGTYTIGNVRFPNITDAIKAANMRNWVRWHESEGHELHTEESSIQVNDGVFNDTDLIKNWKIPEFLTHGVIPNTENTLTNLSDVYDFLKGAVIDDGIYGKNKTRAQWQAEQITNT